MYNQLKMSLHTIVGFGDQSSLVLVFISYQQSWQVVYIEYIGFSYFYSL